METEKLHTVKEAAQILRYSARYMLDLVQQGKVRGIRVGRGRGTWRIPETALHAFISRKN